MICSVYLYDKHHKKWQTLENGPINQALNAKQGTEEWVVKPTNISHLNPEAGLTDSNRYKLEFRCLKMATQLITLLQFKDRNVF